MCVGIGILIFVLPITVILSGFLGYKYGKRMIDALDND